jgi:hypothetical protein
MERVTRKQLVSMTGQLAAACGKKWGKSWVKQSDTCDAHAVIGCWYLDIMNPGDGTTYAVEEITTAGGGVARPLGERRHTARELASALRVALDAVRLALGEDEFAKRIQAFWKTQPQ